VRPCILCIIASTATGPGHCLLAHLSSSDQRSTSDRQSTLIWRKLQPTPSLVAFVARNKETSLFLQLSHILWLNLLHLVQMNQFIVFTGSHTCGAQCFDDLPSNCRGYEVHVEFVNCRCTKHHCLVGTWGRCT
jgi:hypothetical protein